MSYQLHYDNLRTLVSEDPALGALPSYPTVRRYMKSCGMLRQRARRSCKERDASVDVEVQGRETRHHDRARNSSGEFAKTTLSLPELSASSKRERFE